MSERCCETMTSQLDWTCDQHDDPWACPDALISFSAKFQEYGLIVHDGGSANIGINYCPWCGRQLPASQRDRWFEELEARGIDPSNDDVPDEFTDDRWLRVYPGDGAASGPSEFAQLQQSHFPAT